MINGSCTELFNVEVSNSKGNGLSIHISQTTSTLTLSKVFLTGNSGNGLYIDGEPYVLNKRELGSTGLEEAVVILADCVFDTNAVNGIYIKSNAQVEMRNCSVNNNKNTGIRLEQSSSGFLLVNNSIISNNSEYAISGYITNGVLCSDIYLDKQPYSGNTTIIIKDSNFVDNIANGLQIVPGKSSTGRTDLVLVANRFVGGNKTLYINDNYYSVATLTLEMQDNIMENNSQIETEDENLMEFYL